MSNYPESERLTIRERVSLGGLFVLGLGLFIYLTGSWAPGFYWGNYNIFSHLDFYCPACGGSRAINYLIRGDLIQAWRHNQLLIISLPLLLYGFFIALRSVATGHPLAGKYLTPFWIWTFFALVILFGALRNIPLSILDLIRPPT